MNGKVFIDTNVFIYLYSADEPEKSHRAANAIKKYDCLTSTQALNEFSNFCIKKWGFKSAEIGQAINEICEVCSLLYVNEATVLKSLEIHDRYGYAYYDSLMLASALAGGCLALLSEDMSDGQIIDGTLEIVNIFLRNL